MIVIWNLHRNIVSSLHNVFRTKYCVRIFLRKGNLYNGVGFKMGGDIPFSADWGHWRYLYWTLEHFRGRKIALKVYQSLSSIHTFL